MAKVTMKFKILDIRKNGSWILARVSTWDYLEQLSSDFFKYDIQRGIVNNKYPLIPQHYNLTLFISS